MSEAELLHDPQHTAFRSPIADGQVIQEWRVVDRVMRRHMYLVRDSFVGPGDEDMFCVYCGCTEYMPCPGGCAWVVPYVCSSCKDRFYGTEEIRQVHIDKVPDDQTLLEVENYAQLKGGDYALELKGGALHLFRVRVQKAP